MDFSDKSYAELVETLKAQQMLLDQLLEETSQDTALNFAWTGNLGHWYWYIPTNSVTFNPLKVQALGYTMDELPENVNYQFFTDKLHPDDYDATMKAMRDHLSGKMPVYEVEYRIRNKVGEYLWYYDRGRITRWDDEGNPIFLAGIVFDITEKKKKEEDLRNVNLELQEKTSMDEMTGIRNHKGILNFLEDKLTTASSKLSPVSVLMLDIDDFKKVNDTHGHVIGDTVLRDIAQIIQRTIRESDMVGRYGGEEFLVVFDCMNNKLAARVGQRILKSVEAHIFQENIRVTISGGIAEYNGEEALDLVEKADKKLYTAKRTGKNKVVR